MFFHFQSGSQESLLEITNQDFSSSSTDEESDDDSSEVSDGGEEIEEPRGAKVRSDLHHLKNGTIPFLKDTKLFGGENGPTLFDTDVGVYYMRTETLWNLMLMIKLLCIILWLLTIT